MNEARAIFNEIPKIDTKSRSVSPIYREKNTGFFDMLTRRFGRRSNDELYSDEDTRSSSTESCSSTSVQFADRNEVNKPCKQHMSPNCHACNFNPNRNGLNSASDTSIDSMNDNNNIITSANTTPTNGLHVHRRSTTSLCRAIQNLSILSRSQSCSSTITTDKDQNNKKATKKTQPPLPQQQKRILRQPINYVYLKGASGLPTQRVPKSSVCCHYSMHRHAI